LLGAGNVYWGYISHGFGNGKLGSGAGGCVNFAALYNYKFVGVEAGFLSGDMDDLKGWDEDDSAYEYKYRSIGTGHYNVSDFKFGVKVFTEAGDMGYTFFYLGRRYWNSERKQDIIKWDTLETEFNVKVKSKGDGWIIGYRDFSTIGKDNRTAMFVFQSGFFLGKAPCSKLIIRGEDLAYHADTPFTVGAELGAGAAFPKTGLSVIGGLRGEINITRFKNPNLPEYKKPVFGFGNMVLFIECGLMF